MLCCIIINIPPQAAETAQSKEGSKLSRLDKNHRRQSQCLVIEPSVRVSQSY